MRTFADLLALVEQFAPLPKPESASAADNGNGSSTDPLAHDRAIVASVGLDVMGELQDGSVKVFSREHGKIRIFRRLDQLTYADFLQLGGQPVRENMVQSADVEALAPGQHTVKSVKHSMAILAGAERAGEGYERGQGVWRGEDGQLVLVNPGRATVWDGGELIVHRTPRVAGLKVDMDHAAEGTWFDPAGLQADLLAAADGGWVAETVARATDLFSRWYWQTSALVVPEVCVGLVLATWVQSCWRWRPHVAITGPSDSGKSTLFELLETLFGPLAMLSSKSTAAGIGQAVRHHSRAILCDEFESNKHRQEILELFRTSSKGAKSLRGTPSQVSREYHLRHICWVTAIEIGLRRAPDRNRYIWLELEAPPREKRGKLTLPSEPELARLGQRLLAVAVRHVAAGVRLADHHLKGMSIEGVHGRVVESYAVPVGMLAAARGEDEAGAKRSMRLVFERLEKDPSQSTKDETDLLSDILGSKVSLGKGEEANVGQVLNRPSVYPGGWDALERAGIIAVASKDGGAAREAALQSEEDRFGIFFASKFVRRFLLRGTEWADQNIDQLLKRLPGAEKRQRWVSGNRPWGVVVPWRLLREKYLEEEDEAGGF